MRVIGNQTKNMNRKGILTLIDSKIIPKSNIILREDQIKRFQISIFR